MDVNLPVYESFLAFPVPASLKPQGKKIHFSVKISCSSRSLTAALGPCWAGAAAGVLSQARSKPSGAAVSWAAPGTVMGKKNQLVAGFGRMCWPVPGGKVSWNNDHLRGECLVSNIFMWFWLVQENNNNKTHTQKKAWFDTTNMKSKGKFQHLCCIKCGDFFFFFQWEHERAVKLDVGEIALKETLYSIQKGDFCTGDGSGCTPQRMELCRQQVSWWMCWGKAWWATALLGMAVALLAGLLQLPARLH